MKLVRVTSVAGLPLFLYRPVEALRSSTKQWIGEGGGLDDRNLQGSFHLEVDDLRSCGKRN